MCKSESVYYFLFKSDILSGLHVLSEENKITKFASSILLKKLNLSAHWCLPSSLLNKDTSRNVFFRVLTYIWLIFPF